MIRTVMLDFFGTLVRYDPAHTTGDRDGAYDWVCRHGGDLGPAQYDAAWLATWRGFEDRAAVDLREFALTDLSARFLAEVCPTPITDRGVAEFVEVYLTAWTAAVHPVEGLGDILSDLADRYRLAVVTNTYHSALVPGLLARYGVSDTIGDVVTSVDVGWRKPHGKIYEYALRATGSAAASAAFIGDSFRPDYVGPTAAGMQAFLIDPGREQPVPGRHRLATLAEAPAALQACGSPRPADA